MAPVRSEPSIFTPDRRLRVFVSSTLRELAAERAAAREVIEQSHLTPVLFELGARPHPPRELYRAYIEQSDVFVGIYGDRYGWVAPDAEISGIEDEYVLSHGKPRLVYLRESASDREPRLAEMLERMQSDGLSYRAFRDADELRSLLADDLAVLLSERFMAAASTDGPGAAPADGDSLPAPANRFVGRADALAAVGALVRDPEVRLVTLIGPGGIGKTRLAREVAAAVAPQMSDGAVLVMLAAVRAPALVPTAIRTSLGLSDRRDVAVIDQLARHLASREMLLVLDNLEHVIAAAPLITELLEQAPHLTVLATSREPLRLTAEYTFTVPPLAVPAGDAPIDELADAEGVQLFVDRARAARHDLAVQGEDVRVVADIVRRLDGLPLAIELAAARVRLLDPEEIFRRLEHRLSLLTGGARDLPERQQTMRLTIQWSYDLLDDSERMLFDRLGVFVGGFALDSVDAVCRTTPERDVLDDLGGLVDRSLVAADGGAGGTPRFTMLETVREFAVEQLVARGEHELLHRRHAEHFLGLVLELEPGYEAGREIAVVERCTADLENLRRAFDWFIDHDAPDRATVLARAVWRFWWVANLFEEGIDRVARILEQTDRLSEHDRADASFIRGHLAYGLTDYDHAVPDLEDALAGYRACGDELGMALASVPLGVILTERGDDERSEALLRAAVEIAEGSQQDWVAAFSKMAMAARLMSCDQPNVAVPMLRQSVEHCRAIGTEVLLSYGLTYLGRALLAVGDNSAARSTFAEALDRAAPMGSREPVTRVLVGLAAIALDEHDSATAARFLGAADSVRRSIGAPLWPLDVAGALEPQIRDALGNDDFDARFAEGASSTFDEAVRSASAFLGPPDLIGSGVQSGKT